MLRRDYYIRPTEMDLFIYEKLIPKDHHLRQVKAVIDFEFVREEVKSGYSERMGRTAIDPVRMFKLGYLQYHYNLSDRQVIAEAQVNVAYRYFLDLSLESELPVPSLLSQFRRRLGPEGYKRLFDGIVSQGRREGLVKDRLRLKDATHVIANIAIPSTIGLVAQVREGLLKALEPYERQEVELARVEAMVIGQSSADLKNEERLLQRVSHLQRLVSWGDEVERGLRGQAEGVHKGDLESLTRALNTAHHLLADQADPKKKDRLRSATDTDARGGKHGAYFDGYLCDINLDPDSEILTALEVLPANGDEAADARTLIEAEQSAHDNQVEAISIDSVGFQGAVLRDLSDPTDLDLTVYVPPHSQGLKENDYFKPTDFSFSDDGLELICPNGEQTASRHRNDKDSAWVYQFKRPQCAGCALLEDCMKQFAPKARPQCQQK